MARLVYHFAAYILFFISIKGFLSKIDLFIFSHTGENVYFVLCGLPALRRIPPEMHKIPLYAP